MMKRTVMMMKTVKPVHLVLGVNVRASDDDGDDVDDDVGLS